MKKCRSPFVSVKFDILIQTYLNFPKTLKIITICFSFSNPLRGLPNFTIYQKRSAKKHFVFIGWNGCSRMNVSACTKKKLILEKEQFQSIFLCESHNWWCLFNFRPTSNILTFFNLHLTLKVEEKMGPNHNWEKDHQLWLIVGNLPERKEKKWNSQSEERLKKKPVWTRKVSMLDLLINNLASKLVTRQILEGKI